MDADEVVDSAEGGENASLHVHPKLTCNDKDLEAALEHPKNALDHVSCLGVTEVVQLLCIGGATSGLVRCTKKIFRATYRTAALPHSAK